MRHSQYTANPLNPPYQGDFEDFAPVEIIGKCILISRVYYYSSCCLPDNTTYMSPLWGLRLWKYTLFYTHVAPLGLKYLKDSQTIHIAFLRDLIRAERNGHRSLIQ